MSRSIHLLYIVLTNLILINVSSAQADNSTHKPPIGIGAGYTGDLIHNNPGGIRKGSLYFGKADFNVTFDTKNAGLWDGGQFKAGLINTHGSRQTGSFIGDYQGVSNIEAGNLTLLEELWYSQSIGEFSFTAGLQDMAADFGVSEFSSQLLNGSFGTVATLSHNLPAPVFPMTALGFKTIWSVRDDLGLKLAFFDGMPDDLSRNPYNISWHLDASGGFITIAEIDLTAEVVRGFPASIKAGSYYHDHRSCKDHSCGIGYRDNYGFYLITDQLIMDNADGSKIGLFTQTGLSPSSINENNIYLGAGFSYEGLFNKDMPDALGLGIAHAGFSSDRRSETTLEFSYKYYLNANISIQPDFQYVINPAGGEDIKLKNTSAGILRFAFNF